MVQRVAAGCACVRACARARRCASQRRAGARARACAGGREAGTAARCWAPSHHQQAQQVRVRVRQQLRREDHDPQAVLMLLLLLPWLLQLRVVAGAALQVAHVDGAEAEQEAGAQAQRSHLRCARIEIHDGAVYVADRVQKRTAHGLEQPAARQRRRRRRRRHVATRPAPVGARAAGASPPARAQMLLLLPFRAKTPLRVLSSIAVGATGQQRQPV